MSAEPPRPLAEGLAARRRPGAGDQVLWIHGYTLDSTSWQDLWDRLPGWSHIGLDLPGHGASRPLAPDEDLPSLARCIGRAAAGEGVRHLVALSFGTIVALQVAIEHPGAFASITLGAPALGGGPQDPEAERLYAVLLDLYRQRGRGPHLDALWLGAESPVFRGLDRGSGLWRQIAALVERHGWGELATGAMGRLTAHPQSRRDLGSVRAAMLVLVGDRDMVAFRRSAEILRRSVPAAERLYLPGAGHLCLLEEPERTACLLSAHLRRHAERPPVP